MKRLIVLVACSAPAKPPLPPIVIDKPPDAAVVVEDKGVEPPEPTLRLPKNFVPTGYDATLAIDPAKTTFDGTIVITGHVAEKSSVIWLHGRHLAVHSASAGDLALDATPHGDDLLELRAKTPIAAGDVSLKLTYTGELDAVNTSGAFVQTVAGKRYVYSQLEAIYARRVFPCVDEPDNKVPWHLTLEVPKDQIGVSNTAVEKEEVLGDKKRVAFKTTKPLPSYLVAFGVGPFEIVDAGATKSGVPVRAIVLAGRTADAAWTVKTTPQILDLLEDFYGIRYPYDKLDVMSIPVTVGFGAMENAGLVTFSESLLLFDQKHPSRERQHVWVVVCAHELAHQWFGDYVTMAWWDDIWLNEGFADWMERKISAKFDPSWHDELGDIDERDTALGADSLTTARRVRQPIESTEDIYNVFDGITYSKGASVLNMFESYVGADTFKKGVREYLQSKAFGNATVTDFVGAIGKAAGKDLAPAFATFLDQGGAPELTATLSCGKQPALALTQTRYVPAGSVDPPPGKPWLIPICVAYDKDGARGQACTLLDSDTGTLALDAKKCPRWVMPNVRGRGYYHTAPTTAQVTALRDEAWDKLDWAERRAVFTDVEVLSRHGKLPLPLALSFIPKLLAGGDRFVIGDALGFPDEFDDFVPADLRGKYEAWIRMTFGPAAAKVGLAPADGDDLDVQTTRGQLVGTVAGLGRDPALIADAVKLAAKWHDLPQAIRGQVLSLAVDADRDLFDQVIKDVYTETDRARRDEMLSALAHVRDTDRQKRALQLVLDPKLDIRETLGMLYATPTPANLAVSQAFFLAHDKDILARMPHDDVTGASSGIASLFTRSCDAAKRDEVRAFLGTEFTSIPGSEHTIKEDLEEMDQCIARRAALEPELRGWLTGVKIPSPPKKDGKAKAPKKS